jgi:glutamyl-tRNA reductase
VIVAGAARSERLLLVGTSHRLAPIALRERLHVGPHESGTVALQLAKDGEAIVLATCNRTEVYIAGDDPAVAQARAVAELARRGRLPPADLEPALQVAEDERVVLHLFRVAAGLESLVPGEPQILGQLRVAHEQAKAAGAAGPLLDRLVGHALHAGKRVRAETAVGERPASVAAAAAQLARQVFGDLAGRRVLIVGAGKMSEIAAASLVAGGVENVFIANRTLGRAAALASRFGGHAVGFDRLAAELVQADVVVSSTRCPRFVLTAAELTEALPHRRGRPLLLIDIAVPRDLDPAIGKLGDCYLYDLDDLGAVVRESGAEARSALADAEAIVAEEAERFVARHRSLDAVPVIVSLRRRAEQIRTAELARANGKLDALAPAERRAVEAMTAQIVNKLLHAPTVRIKAVADRADRERYAAALEHLFGLEEIA